VQLLEGNSLEKSIDDLVLDLEEAENFNSARMPPTLSLSPSTREIIPVPSKQVGVSVTGSSELELGGLHEESGDDDEDDDEEEDAALLLSKYESKYLFMCTFLNYRICSCS